MPNLFACRRCFQVLILPPAAAGQTARCPNCQSEFEIPPADQLAEAAPAMLMGTALTRGVRVVTAADGERLEAASEHAAARHLAAHIELTAAARRSQRLASRLRFLRLLQTGRRLLDHSTGRLGGLCLTLALGAAFLVLLTITFSSSALASMVAALVGVLLATVAYLPFSFVPHDEALAEAAIRYGEQADAANLIRAKCASQEAELARQMAAAQADWRRAREHLEKKPPAAAPPRSPG